MSDNLFGGVTLHAFGAGIPTDDLPPGSNMKMA